MKACCPPARPGMRVMHRRPRVRAVRAECLLTLQLQSSSFPSHSTQVDLRLNTTDAYAEFNFNFFFENTYNTPSQQQVTLKNVKVRECAAAQALWAPSDACLKGGVE
jgi:hypothetical protein